MVYYKTIWVYIKLLLNLDHSLNNYFKERIRNKVLNHLINLSEKLRKEYLKIKEIITIKNFKNKSKSKNKDKDKDKNKNNKNKNKNKYKSINKNSK